MKHLKTLSQHYYKVTQYLDDELVSNGFDQLRRVVLRGDKMSFTWSNRMSFTIDLHTGCLRFTLLHLILLHTSQEIVTTFGMFDVLDAEVDSFGDDSVSQLFVDDNTDSSSRHVEHSSSFAVVVFVWHTLVDGSITLNINNITDLVCLQVGGEMFNSCLSELLGEKISRSSSFTVWICHC